MTALLVEVTAERHFSWRTKCEETQPRTSHAAQKLARTEAATHTHTQTHTEKHTPNIHTTFLPLDEKRWFKTFWKHRESESCQEVRI